MIESVLAVKKISVHYGGVHALTDVSLAIDEGEIVALMGPNGAGKSTVLRALFGLAPIDRGTVLWHKQPILPTPHEMVMRGIAFVPQGRRVFPSLSVFENIEIGGFTISNRNEIQRRIEELLETFPALKSKLHERAGALSGGQQQMLAIARGLMTNPKVLLLDEPTLGLAPKIVQEVFTLLQEINQRHNTALLIVEHNIKSLFSIADHVYILEKGAVVAEGTAEKMKDTELLKKIFLGAEI